VSRETVRSISNLLREVNFGAPCDDPEFFERKAAVWDAVAADDPHLAEQAAECAAAARARARQLRGEGR